MTRSLGLHHVACHLIGNNRLIVCSINVSGAALAQAMNHVAMHCVINWDRNHQSFFNGVVFILHGAFGNTIDAVNLQGQHFASSNRKKHSNHFCGDLMLDFEPGSIDPPPIPQVQEIAKEAKASSSRDHKSSGIQAPHPNDKAEGRSAEG